MRSGLVALLAFLDDEPAWGRVLFLHAPADRTTAFRDEQRVLGVLTGLLDDDSPQAIAELSCEPQLTAELVIGGVLSVIRARMTDGDGGALVELAPSLMAFIVVAYLGEAAANAELSTDYADIPEARELPTVSPIPVTRRTTLVLGAIARAPRSSNRAIAAAAGVDDEGQTSHLLRRLAQRGLIRKVAPRSGSRRENAWVLTGSGQRVIELLGLASAADAHVSSSTCITEAA